MRIDVYSIYSSTAWSIVRTTTARETVRLVIRTLKVINQSVCVSTKRYFPIARISFDTFVYFVLIKSDRRSVSKSDD